MKRTAQCMICQHLLLFDAKEGVRYVCTLKGKRITEEPEKCDGFKEHKKQNKL